MKMIRIIATDKSGEVYFGPKTVAEAEAVIRNMDADPSRVVSDMRRAGYNAAANRVARKFIER